MGVGRRLSREHFSQADQCITLITAIKKYRWTCGFKTHTLIDASIHSFRTGAGYVSRHDIPCTSASSQYQLPFFLFSQYVIITSTFPSVAVAVSALL